MSFTLLAHLLSPHPPPLLTPQAARGGQAPAGGAGAHCGQVAARVRRGRRRCGGHLVGQGAAAGQEGGPRLRACVLLAVVFAVKPLRECVAGDVFVCGLLLLLGCVCRRTRAWKEGGGGGA
jgi:hypothetical protein